MARIISFTETLRELPHALPDAESLSVELVREYFHLSQADQIGALAKILPRFSAAELADILKAIRQSFHPISTGSADAVIDISSGRK